MDDLMGLLFGVFVLVAVFAGKQKQMKHSAGKTTRPEASSAVQKQAAKPTPDALPLQGERPHQPAPHVHEIKPRVAVTPHTADMFEGSMHAETGEGFDPCHEEALSPLVEPCMVAPQSASPASPSSGLRLNWTGDEMMCAVVMQEILQRPVSRRR